MANRSHSFCLSHSLTLTPSRPDQIKLLVFVTRMGDIACLPLLEAINTAQHPLDYYSYSLPACLRMYDGSPCADWLGLFLEQ